MASENREVFTELEKVGIMIAGSYLIQKQKMQLHLHQGNIFGLPMVMKSEMTLDHPERNN